MMRNYSAAAAVGDDGSIPFVRLYRQNPDGSCHQYLRGMSPPLFLRNSRIIDLPSFNDFGMGGSCDGLFYLDDCEGKQAVIINPLTTQFKFLPPSGVKRPPKSNHFSCSACGFGFDSLSNDYKVVRFVKNCFEIYDEDGYVGVLFLGRQVEIFSLKTNCWKEIPFPNLVQDDIVCGSGLYVNGKCYWIICGPLRVLSFEFEKECFSIIALPKVKGELMDLHEYKGSLAVIGYEESGLNRSFEAWILKEEERWEKLFEVGAPGSVCRTLGFGNNGRVLFIEGNVTFGDKCCTMLLEYDLMSGDLKQHPMVHQQAIMQIFSFSIGKTVWLPDAEFANPIKEVGIQGIEIIPSGESTNAKQIAEETQNQVNEIFLGNERMEFSSRIESAA